MDGLACSLKLFLHDVGRPAVVGIVCQPDLLKIPTGWLSDLVEEVHMEHQQPRGDQRCVPCLSQAVPKESIFHIGQIWMRFLYPKDLLLLLLSKR